MEEIDVFKIKDDDSVPKTQMTISGLAFFGYPTKCLYIGQLETSECVGHDLQGDKSPV